MAIVPVRGTFWGSGSHVARYQAMRVIKEYHHQPVSKSCGLGLLWRSLTADSAQARRAAMHLSLERVSRAKDLSQR